MGEGGCSKKEQVLVAALPGDDTPEVHVARFDPADGMLSLRAATLEANGGVSLGADRRVLLKKAGLVQAVGGGEVNVFGSDGRLLVQLHLESTEDERSWLECLRAAVVSGSSNPKDEQKESDTHVRVDSQESDDEVSMLRARSQQLQNRIGILEGVAERRDKQLQKTLKRLEGAMQMLSAVQDMCGQQRNVIDSQRIAITELRQECGILDESKHLDKSGAPRAADGQRTADGDKEVDKESSENDGGNEIESSGEVAELECEVAAKSQQMLSLVQQADEMQAALRELRALQSKADGVADIATTAASAAVAGMGKELGVFKAAGSSKIGNDAGSSAVGAMIPSEQTSMSMHAAAAAAATAVQDDTAAPSGAVLSQLEALEREKANFEGMLRDSQDEHANLLSRLNEMRSLMSMLGMKEEDMDLGSSDEEGVGHS
eukprot:TRINITY_DN11534_c0_g1_i1.p1 TRINITY_DN11534_c0_g1~~TRINITY_DN11534_c0_g1_i1.p1  ORF type:complete len:459 (-),score=100.84 TRINITY_DN11534_c0_g1_i1:142-1437(-)